MSESTSLRSSTTDRVDYLDGIRGLAVGAVLVVHWNGGVVPGYFLGGYIGVDLFFVLSGFLITTILERREHGSLGERYRHFLSARVNRLYPALLGFLAGILLIETFGFGLAPDVARPEPLSYLLALTQTTWIIGVAPDWFDPARGYVMLGHTWTLAVEWVFYLVWPAALLWYNRRARVPWKAVAGTAVGIYLISAIVMPWEWVYISPLSRMSQFLAGCALALYLDQRAPRTAAPTARQRRVAMLVTLGIVGWLGMYTVSDISHESGTYRWLGFPLAAIAGVALIVLGRDHKPVASLLGWGPLRLLGRWSYSVYLWHLPLYLLIDRNELGAGRFAVGIYILIATAVIGGLSYRFLERPYLKRRRSGSIVGQALVGDRTAPERAAP